MKQKYNFCGWATRNDLRCSDGRTIRRDAFKEMDGKYVPLVYMHDHNDPTNVLGKALLHNTSEGVYAYCFLNDSDKAKHVDLMIEHGDVNALSINANNLVERNGSVYHGVIREVSVVLAGANPGAYIEFPEIAHGEEGYTDKAVIYTGELIHGAGEVDLPDDELSHADGEGKKEDGTTEEAKSSVNPKKVFDAMSDEQKDAVYFLVGAAVEDALASKGKEASHSENMEGDEMKHNAFENGENKTGATLSHADEETIIKMAKSGQIGTLQGAMALFAESNSLQHDDSDPRPVSGFEEESLGMLFPEYQDLKKGAPELITDDQTWIPGIIRGTSKTPFSRIRTRQVDIRNIDKIHDDMRARGYKKGTLKALTGNYSLARRQTDPQTIYVKNALNRDDIVDITDFDYVSYQYQIDRMMLEEEIALAIMFGDGREEGDPDKIDPIHIRPIWTDDELYTLHVDVDIAGAKRTLQGSSTSANFGENYVYAEAIITALLYAREKYKGSGQPNFYCTPHLINVMSLARDLNGRRIYDNINDIAAALNVKQIITVEQMEGKQRTIGGDKPSKRDLLALVFNPSDYNVGSTKGGEITHFRQFDIDFNQEKSLIETRISGALTRLWSAIALEIDPDAE